MAVLSYKSTPLFWYLLLLVILYRSLESGSNHLIIIGGLNENSKNKNR